MTSQQVGTSGDSLDKKDRRSNPGWFPGCPIISKVLTAGMKEGASPPNICPCLSPPQHPTRNLSNQDSKCGKTRAVCVCWETWRTFLLLTHAITEEGRRGSQKRRKRQVLRMEETRKPEGKNRDSAAGCSHDDAHTHTRTGRTFILCSIGS